MRTAPRSPTSLLALATLAVATLGAGAARAADPEPARAEPARAEQAPAAGADAPRTTPRLLPTPDARWKIALTGVGTTAFWYGAATGFSYLWPDAPGAADLRVPVIGPWRALAHNGCAADEPDCDGFGVVLRTILTTIDGVGQAAGLAILAEGLFLPTQEAAFRARSGAPVPAPAPRPATPEAPPTNLYYLPAPATVGSGYGVAWSGAF
jgi:hypothetical protein